MRLPAQVKPINRNSMSSIDLNNNVTPSATIGECFIKCNTNNSRSKGTGWGSGCLEGCNYALSSNQSNQVNQCKQNCSNLEPKRRSSCLAGCR